MQAPAAAAGFAGGAPRVVATLLGHAHVEMALRCLGSLLRFSADPLRLRVHDDGSLTPSDRERLAAGLAGPEVVSRQEADDRLAGLLAARPASRAFRAGNPLALTLLAQQAGCRLLDPGAIGIPVPGRAPRPAQVALHFVSPVRGLLAAFGAAAGPGETAPMAAPVELHSVAAPRLTAAALAASEARR